MNEVLLPMMAAMITAAVSAIATYGAVRRAKSGAIKTTEADVLWTEAGKIRRELAERVQELEQHIERNDSEIAALRTENAGLKHEVLTLRSENAALKVQVEELRAENVELRKEQAKGVTS